jgi:hypothetical protein
MKIVSIVAMLIAATMICAYAQEEHDGRYQFYTLKSGNNDLAFLLDTSTGRTWQVFVDSTGKVTQLSAITVEGVAYTEKDIEQLYSKVQSENIAELSTSNSVTKVELNKLYGYGLDNDKLIIIRDKVKDLALKKR